MTGEYRCAISLSQLCDLRERVEGGREGGREENGIRGRNVGKVSSSVFLLSQVCSCQGGSLSCSLTGQLLHQSIATQSNSMDPTRQAERSNRCVFVCVCVRACVCVHACVWVHMHVCLCVCSACCNSVFIMFMY